MGRLAANKGNGKCVSTDDPLTVSPMPSDTVILSFPPGATKQCVNTAELADAVEVINNVRINGKPVVVIKSKIPKSSGAPPNAVRGVKSPPPANNRCTFESASGTVRAGGSYLIRHRDVTSQNAGNCSGAVKLKEAFSLDGSGIVLDPNMSDKDKEAVLSNLEKMAERPRTRELLDTIRNNYLNRINKGKLANMITISTKTVDSLSRPIPSNVVPWDNATFPVDANQRTFLETDPLPNLYNGIGMNSFVQFYPFDRVESGYSESFLDSMGVTDFPPEMNLAHELCHGLRYGNGTVSEGTSIGKILDGSPAIKPMPNDELQALGICPESDTRLAESHFLEERGLSSIIRTSHGREEGHFPYDPKKESIAPIAFATGKNGEHFVYCNR